MILDSEELENHFTRAAEAILSEANRRRLPEIISDYGIPIEQEEVSAPEDRGLKTPKVGIWQAQMENGETWFVRASPDPERLWADVDRIPPKRSRPRIAFLGESVARGLFYDPYFTFADCLRTVLKFSKTEAEVIDLSRTDLHLPQLVELMREAVMLQPDALIIFAGNNWKLTYDNPQFSFLEVTRILSQGGRISELREYCDNILRDQVRQFIYTAAGISKEHGIPVVFMLPEFNLADWRNEYAEEIPLLDSSQTTAWNSALKKAAESFAEGDMKLAEKFAQKMIEIDEGASPAGFEILAMCALRGGNAVWARSLLEAARDAGWFLPIRRSPRCYGIIQEVFRNESESEGVALVDLPKRFSEYLSGELPGRRLFLDYCHLTLEGIRIAAASVIERLLPLLGKEFQPWRRLATADINLEPEALAHAYFRASLHNARWWQGREVVEYQCREALTQAPEVADVMLRFLDSELRRAPSAMCGSMAPLASHKSFSAYPLFHRFPTRQKSLNLLLLEVLISVLTPAMPEVREKASSLLKAEHCLTSTPIDLLQEPYWNESLGWSQPNSAVYYKAYRPQSTFRIVCSTASPIRLTFTARISDIGTRKRFASLYLNATKIASYGVSSRWRKYEVEIPGDLLAEGLNTILIQWPKRSWAIKERIIHILGQVESDRSFEMWPIYGELHSFKAVADNPDTQKYSNEH
jgi:hypothetical protein